MTQDDHLAAGAWVACDCHYDFRRLKYTARQQKHFVGCSLRSNKTRIMNSLMRYTAAKSHLPPPGNIVVGDN